jgi:polyribonucleotide nucleotidyltransferase
MASICGGTLALMDAGVPVKTPVAGVAMGLVKEGERWAVLSDIAGEEDHYGDMDFKVAGTREGITALQMDIKVGGLKPELMAQALEQARAGRLYILDRMLEALAAPRPDISPYAPRILTIRVPVDKIRDVIGPGGKMIRSIVERTGCKIDIEDDGRVSIASVDESAARKAIAIIEELTATPELNKTYLGKVVRVVEFGAFVEILPGTDGLLHVSEMAHHRVNNVHDEVKEGDQVLVKVVSIDPSGKIRLSRKALLDQAQGGVPDGATGGDGGGGSHPPGGGPGGGQPHGHGPGGHGRNHDRRHGRGGHGGHDRGGPGGRGGGPGRHDHGRGPRG